MIRFSLLVILATLLLQPAWAQNGVFDVRLSLNKVDCNNQKIQVNVAVKAHDHDTEFSMGNGNFRFLYDARVLQHPVLLEEYNFSSGGQAADISYNPQTLTGSFERTTKGIVSLNVIHSGSSPKATRVLSSDWTPVATIQFDMVNRQGLVGTTLAWNDDKTFPVTGLSEITTSGRDVAGAFVVKASGTFQNLTIDALADICSGTGSAEQGELVIPDGFSPNGDGLNDQFVIYNLGALKASLSVYNRDGLVVYSNSNYQNDWNGLTDKGALLEGTYFFSLQLSDGRLFRRAMTIRH